MGRTKARIVSRGGPETLLKASKKIIKIALNETGQLWHQKFLPLHFMSSANYRYRTADTYQPRSRDYMKRKRLAFGHSLPLVFTGELRRGMLRERRVTGSAKRAVVTLKGTRYLYPFKKDAKDHDKAKEITATHPQELTTMGKRLKLNIERRYNANKEKKTERIS